MASSFSTWINGMLNGALVVILICAGDLPRDACTEATARAVISTRVEPVICGVGAISATAGVNGVGPGEFSRIRCRQGK
jgi:hypothetical protein